MATTWKQVVYDVADAYREADGSTAKIPVGQLADKVREGAGIPYAGDNPLTIGQSGYSFEPKTLLKEGLTIVNGVNGEDLTDVEARMSLAIEELNRIANRKVSESKNNGLYVWEKYEITEKTVSKPSIVLTGVCAEGIATTCDTVDLAMVDASFFDGFTYSPRKFTYDETNGFRYISNDANVHAAIWEAKTQTITIPTQSGKFSGATFSYSGTKTVPAKGEFLVYMVADDPNSYPNGGELDGYWYELLTDPVDLAKELDLIPENIRKGIDIFGVIGAMSEGVSGVDYGEVTLSSRVSSITIEHNLGIVPSWACLIQKELEYGGYTTAGNIDNKVLYADTSWYVQNGNITKTDKTVIFNYGGYNNYRATTYYWFVVA